MSGLRHDATNFLADIVAGVEALRRLQGKQSEGTVDQRFDRVAENLRSTCEGLQKMIRDFTVDLRPSSTNRPQRTPISVPESSGPTGPAPITAGPLFEEARDLFRYLSEAQSIQIKCDPAVDTQFLGHSQLLRVLAILIQNAAEAIGTNGTITLRARRAKAHLKGTRTEAVILDVEDTGPGIPAEVQERLFHPFFSTKSHGIGLGLATAAWIVAENGGAIQFKTRLGHGTTFTVILPACEKS